MPDLRRLQYFLAVARERNFTRAAEHLHIAQPALSRQVRLFEQELGVELMHRTTHSFELTEAGQLLLDRGPALLRVAEELWRDLRSFGEGSRGRVVVAYGASASYETAPRLLAALDMRHPEMSIVTSLMGSDTMLAAVLDGSVDIGLIRCPPQLDHLDVRPVRRDRQGVLLRKDHALARGRKVALADLAGERLAMHPRDENPGHFDALVELCRESGFEPRMLVRALAFDLAYTPITDGDAVAVIGESSAIGLPAELLWVPLEPEVTLEVAVIARTVAGSAAVEHLLEDIGEVATELGWL